MNTFQDQGGVTVGGEVTYLVAYDRDNKVVQMGDFPHCRMHRSSDRTPRCKAEINITDGEGTSRERCTRERRHGGVHVHHHAPGMPLLAWRVDVEVGGR